MTIDKKTLEELAKVDVLSHPPAILDPDAQELERKIRTIKDTSFTLKLTPSDVEMLSRFASIKNMDWKQYLALEIQENILKQDGHIGKPLIASPSFASGGRKVTGPSLGGLVNRG
jgi:hypothetical protein